MSEEIRGLKEIEKAAGYVVDSRLFGVQNLEQAVALMLLAQAEGRHPMSIVREFFIIDGRPAMRADAMLARFQQAGGRVRWLKLTDSEASAEFSHPLGGTVVIEWSLQRAKRAGLLDKKGSNWLRYPRAMLRARVISEGIRTVFPGVIVGVYTPEEIKDMAAEEPPEVLEAEEIQPSPQSSSQSSPQPLEVKGETPELQLQPEEKEKGEEEEEVKQPQPQPQPQPQQGNGGNGKDNKEVVTLW